jgi:hypothetical protein
MIGHAGLVRRAIRERVRAVESVHKPSPAAVVSERQEERTRPFFDTASTVMAAAEYSKRCTAQRDRATSRACGARA